MPYTTTKTKFEAAFVVKVRFDSMEETSTSGMYSTEIIADYIKRFLRECPELNMNLESDDAAELPFHNRINVTFVSMENYASDVANESRYEPTVFAGPVVSVSTLTNSSTSTSGRTVTRDCPAYNRGLTFSVNRLTPQDVHYLLPTVPNSVNRSIISRIIREYGFTNMEDFVQKYRQQLIEHFESLYNDGLPIDSTDQIG